MNELNRKAADFIDVEHLEQRGVNCGIFRRILMSNQVFLNILVFESQLKVVHMLNSNDMISSLNTSHGYQR